MSLNLVFSDARDVLGVSSDDDPLAIKRAYRRAVLANPPDGDPDAFRRVREAYETLCTPVPRAREMLLRAVPLVAPPKLLVTEELAAPHALATAIFRRVIGRARAQDFAVAARSGRSSVPAPPEVGPNE